MVEIVKSAEQSVNDISDSLFSDLFDSLQGVLEIESEIVFEDEKTEVFVFIDLEQFLNIRVIDFPDHGGFLENQVLLRGSEDLLFDDFGDVGCAVCKPETSVITGGVSQTAVDLAEFLDGFEFSVEFFEDAQPL